MCRLVCDDGVLKPVLEYPVVPSDRREPVDPSLRHSYCLIPILACPCSRSSVEHEVIRPYCPCGVLASDKFDDRCPCILRQDRLSHVVGVGEPPDACRKGLVNRQFRFSDERAAAIP